MRRALVILASLYGSTALSATLSGTIKDNLGTGVPAPEVRLWARSGKGWAISTTIAAASNGAYSFTVSMGQYLIDTRAGGGFTDRWYDADGTGYVQGDADIIDVMDTDVRNGLDIFVEQGGGVDGTARLGTQPASGLQVRVEQVSEPRIHHNDATKTAPHQGDYSMRGVPPGAYRVVAHDQNAQFADAVAPAPLIIAAGLNQTAPQLDLAMANADNYEPNDTPATATPIDAAMFRVPNPPPYTTAGARIAPRNSGDVDWYCLTAQDGERFIAGAEGLLLLGSGMAHESPWVDPVLAAWRPDGGSYAILRQDDDSGPLESDALVDTGELPAGPVCFTVSTYGDTAWAGQGQGSAGDYKLTVRYGNRGPRVTAVRGGNPLPAMVSINEGDLLAIDLAWVDPEGDMVAASWEMRGASGALATAGTFTGATMSTFQWRAPQTSARDSPYALVFHVGDAEITHDLTVTVEVLAVNVAPSVPQPLSPADGGHVATPTPALVCAESIDADEETLSYELELYYGDAGAAAQMRTAVGLDGGWLPDAGGTPATVTFMTTAIPENTHARWRVRAFDGHLANGYSPWSPFATFLVDVTNDPPAAPELTKPGDGETVLLVRPTLSVIPPIDPEDDAFNLFFEVAKDMAFTQQAAVSPAVPVAPGATTMWTLDRDLEWGTQYYARAWAIDARTARGPYSNVNGFMVRANQPPSSPPFTDPGTITCMSGYVGVKPPRAVIGTATDPEMDQIRIQLQVFLASEDTGTATPAFDQTKLQTPGGTEFDTSNVPVPGDLQHRYRARAVDNYGASNWTDCLLTVGMPPPAAGGGSGGAGGGGAGGGGTMTKGCGCTAGTGEGVALALLLALNGLRRRRAAA